jgi:hypothetical protein
MALVCKSSQVLASDLIIDGLLTVSKAGDRIQIDSAIYEIIGF